MHISSKAGSLLDVGVTSLHPEQVSIGGKLLGSFSCGWESSLVMVEAFASARHVTRPENRLFCEGIGVIAAFGDGKVGIGLYMLPVLINGILGCALSFEMCIDSYTVSAAFVKILQRI